MRSQSVWTGREARALRLALRFSVRGFAEYLGVGIRTISQWEAAQTARTPRPHMQSILDTVLAKATPEEQQRFDQLLSQLPDQRATPSWGSGGALERAILAQDAHEAAQFAREISMGKVSGSTLDRFSMDVRRLAVEFVSLPLSELFVEIRDLRNDVFATVRANRLPSQTRQLYVEASRLEGLQAHICLDLGHYREASSHAVTALQFAELAGHNNMVAWVRALQSLIAYWTNQMGEAREYTCAGLAVRTTGSIGSRLYGLDARAAAAVGDKAGALRSLARAEDSRAGASTDDSEVGVFLFPAAKQATYAGTALLALGDRHSAAKAVTASSTAIQLYRTSSPDDRSSGDVLAAQLDLASAHLRMSQLDGVSEILRPVFEVPQTLRTASIVKRANVIRATIRSGPHGRSVDAARLCSQLEDFCAKPPALPISSGG